MANTDTGQSNALQVFDSIITQKHQVVMPLALSGKVLADKLIESLENNKSPLLPKDGVINEKPVWNARTGALCRSITLLALLERRAELNTDTNAFVTWQSIYTARTQGVNTAVRKGEHGLNMTLVDAKDREQTLRWLNLSQLTDGKALLDYFGARPEIDIAAKKVVVCSARNHIDYLAQVMAAITTCTPLSVTDAQKDAFVYNIVADLSRPRTHGEPNRLAIYHIANRAWKKAGQYIEAMNEVAAPRHKRTAKAREEYGMSR